MSDVKNVYAVVGELRKSARSVDRPWALDSYGPAIEAREESSGELLIPTGTTDLAIPKGAISTITLVHLRLDEAKDGSLKGKFKALTADAATAVKLGRLHIMEDTSLEDILLTNDSGDTARLIYHLAGE